jgi:probable phosphoglycerate mutase
MTYDLPLTTKKTIYLIRHGQTDYNIRQVVQGRGVNSDLNETGRQQARLFFDAYKHIPFDVVYTSKLKRTNQTVQHFLDLGIPNIQLPNLDEIDWGIFEGVEHNPSLQETYHTIVNHWRNGDLHIKIEGGESAQDLYERISPFIDEIKNTEHQTILACTHGRTLRMLMCLFTGKDICLMDDYEHHNLCLYKLTYDGSDFHIELENDISHLEFENA